MPKIVWFALISIMSPFAANAAAGPSQSPTDIRASTAVITRIILPQRPKFVSSPVANLEGLSLGIDSGSYFSERPNYSYSPAGAGNTKPATDSSDGGAEPQTSFFAAQTTWRRYWNPVAMDESGLLAGVSFDARWIVNSKYNKELQVPELYIGWSGAGYANLIVGRKLETWSQLDEDWDLGAIQPMAKFNPARSTQQGLTGVFATFQAQVMPVRLTVFGSPMYIPNQGPDYVDEDGRIRSDNPWFQTPPGQLKVGSGATGIRYNIKTPQTGDIISQESGGGILLFGNRNFGPSLQLSYFNGPRNELSVPIEGYLQLSAKDTQAVVNVYPEVKHHEVWAANIQARSPHGGIWLSGLVDSPTQVDHDSKLTYQDVTRFAYVSPGFDWFPFSLGPNAMSVQSSYIKKVEGSTKEVGPLASADNDLFAQPAWIEEAVQVRSRLPFRLTRSQSLELGVRWLEELKQRGTLVTFDATYLPFAKRQWMLMAGMDLLGSRADDDSAVGFFARNRGNDRVYGGMKYVF